MTDAPNATGVGGSQKADPERLVLRARPGRVVRFRRGAIIVLAALGLTAIVAATWMALKPPAIRLFAGDEEKVQVAAPPDALAGAPRSYGDVPQLGPPLPGDLGKPILDHRREAGMAVPDSPGADAAARAAQEAEAERQARAAERQAARESDVMLQLTGAGHPDQPGAGPGERVRPQPADPLTLSVGLDPAKDANAPQRKVDVLTSKDQGGDINPHSLVEPVSPYTLSAGTVIAASLITGLNSDLPGLVTAQVTENVHDSATGRILLIPQGSRLIGSYDSVVAFGQTRALVVWQRIILPDGASIRIDNVPATDTKGYVGLSDKIDRHSWQLLKGVALSTLLGVGAELTFTDESDLVEAIRESAQQSGARAGDQLVRRTLDVQPTIAVRPGWPLRVVLHKDLVLRPWRTARK